MWKGEEMLMMMEEEMMMSGSQLSVLAVCMSSTA